MAITVRVAQSYLDAKFPGLTPSQYAQITVPLEDISFNGVNTPIIPDPRGRRMIEGWMSTSYEGNTHGVMVTIAGVTLDEQNLKIASSGVGGNLVNNIAMQIDRGVFEVYKSDGVGLTKADMLNLNF